MTLGLLGQIPLAAMTRATHDTTFFGVVWCGLFLTVFDYK
jgi:hypothetical protein